MWVMAESGGGGQDSRDRDGVALEDGRGESKQ